MKKWAFLGVVPHTGGTWTVFETLRSGMMLHGIDLRWVVAGKPALIAMQYARMGKETLELGEVVAPEETDESRIAHRLARHLETEYDGAIINVLCDRLCINMMQYLPASFRRIMLVHNITVGTYEAARSIRDYVHATVGVSQRITSDLIQKYGFNPANTITIPNAVPVDAFYSKPSRRSQRLRILVLSRIENKSKGSFQIPRILQQLEALGVPYTCTVIGEGPDRAEMKRRCAGLKVHFVGRIPSDQVPRAVSFHDVYLFPSIYEGFALSLVEAMAGGCVPVASCLKGVTDQIVTNRESGFLISPSNTVGFTLALQALSEQPEMKKQMRDTAQSYVREHFSVSVASDRFTELMDQVNQSAGHLPGKIKSLEHWSYSRSMRDGLRSLLPESLKSHLRHLRERFIWLSFS